MKVFIGHMNLDVGWAEAFRYGLENGYGLDIFLAHRDIEPSKDWQDEIIIALKDCSIYLPILTHSFYEKPEWTCQEAGIAYYLEKLIIPIKINANPLGFMSRFQALPVNGNTLLVIKNACKKIAVTIAQNPHLGVTFKNHLIERFGDSYSWAESTNSAETIELIDDYSLSQIENIMRKTISNFQISQSFKGRAIIGSVVEPYKDKVDKKLYEKFLLSNPR